MLALNGVEAWGLEVSKKAVDTANANIKSQLAEPSSDNFGTGERPSKSAPAKVVLGDFFQRDWENQIDAHFEGFDIIYDYTVRPALRNPTLTLTGPSFSVRCYLRCDATGRNECHSCCHQRAN